MARKPIGKIALEAAEVIPATRSTMLRSPPLLFGVFFLLFTTSITLFHVSDADAATESGPMTFTYKNDHFAQLGMDFRFMRLDSS
jgi:hypothetical protein